MIQLVILFLESLGGGELLLILVFILIFFGSKNIPGLARGLGKGIREMKDAMNGVQQEIRKGIHEVERETDSVLKDVQVVEEAPIATQAAQDQAPELPVIAPDERSSSR
ncbi:MAG: twin-arginine translocase TatA/TatE family subunit [Sphingobacteriales bacterium]|nr:twin-arginine translocase TatA/TatE family subunit [Sphingobacteriales bacterium]